MNGRGAIGRAMADARFHNNQSARDALADFDRAKAELARQANASHGAGDAA